MQIKRIHEPALRMEVFIRPFTIWFEIQNNRGSRKARRTIALMIFRALRDTFDHLDYVFLRDNTTQWGPDFRYPDDYRIYTDRQVPQIKTSNQKLGFHLRTQRLELGLTLTQLSKISKISRTHLSEIEHGKHTAKPYTLEKIKMAFASWHGPCTSPKP